MEFEIKSNVLEDTTLYKIQEFNSSLVTTDFNIDAMNEILKMYFSGNKDETLIQEVQRTLYEYTTYSLRTARLKNAKKTFKGHDNNLIESFATSFNLFELMNRYYSLRDDCKPSTFAHRVVSSRFINYLSKHRLQDKELKENWNELSTREHVLGKVQTSETTFAYGSTLSMDTLEDNGIELVAPSDDNSDLERKATYEYYDLLIECLKTTEDLDDEIKAKYIDYLENRDDTTLLRERYKTGNKGIRNIQKEAYKFASERIGTFEDYLERLIP